MRKKGTHTWDLYLKYTKCPQCDFIIEDRLPFHYQLGKYVKSLQCPRCQHEFTLEKPASAEPIGPIFGQAPKPEFDWSESK